MRSKEALDKLFGGPEPLNPWFEFFSIEAFEVEGCATARSLGHVAMMDPTRRTAMT